MIEKIKKYMLFIKGLLARKKNLVSNNVLIIFSAALGDSILFINFMRHIMNKYPIGGGTELTILCRENVKNLYVNKLGFDERYFCRNRRLP